MKFAFILTPLAIVAFLLSPLGQLACKSKGITATGPVVAKDYPVAPQQQISVGGGLHLILVPGDGTSVHIEAEEVIHQHLEIKTEKGCLHVGLKPFTTIRGKHTFRVTYPSQNIAEINGSGGVNVDAQNVFSPQQVKMSYSGGCRVKADVITELLEINGSGGVDINLQGTVGQSSKMSYSGGCKVNATITTQQLEANGSGGVNMTLRGTADQFRSSLSGGCRMEAKGLTTKDFEGHFSGGASATAHITTNLSFSGSGGCDLAYSGSAVVVKKELNGGASLRKID